MRRLGIHVEIELSSESSGVADAQVIAAHQVDALDASPKIVVGLQSEGDVGQRSQADQCDLVGQLDDIEES